MTVGLFGNQSFCSPTSPKLEESARHGSARYLRGLCPWRSIRLLVGPSLNEIGALLALIGLAVQLYLIDWEIEAQAQAKRTVIYWYRTTSRYRQMIAGMDFGAQLYDYQLSLLERTPNRI